jgi:hypothetical protein
VKIAEASSFHSLNRTLGITQLESKSPCGWSLSRNTQGVRAINVAEDDRVASVERMIDGKLPAEEVVP